MRTIRARFVALAGAVVMVFAGASMQRAASADARPVTTASCKPRFSDVAPSSPFCTAIVYLAKHKIVNGYSDGTFRPSTPVSREAVAAFLYRATHNGAAAPACTSAPFLDVPAHSLFCGAISWLADRHLTSGYRDGRFHPQASTTREAVTSFLYKYIHGTAQAPNSCSSSSFRDVAVTNQFCSYIASLRNRGVVAGYRDGTFHPVEAVSRQAMAQFLYRVLVTPLADITGVINDVSDTPLAGATVYAVPRNAADPTVVAGTTDDSGRFDADHLNGGTGNVGILYFLCVDVPASTSSTPDQCTGDASWDGVPAAGHVGPGAKSYPALQGYTNDVKTLQLFTTTN